jgi:predicted N-acetyltransferase YhbS
MDFRFADAVDIPALTNLINQAFSIERTFKVGDRLDAEEVQHLFDKGRFLVLEEDRQLQGSIYVELRGERAYLGLLSVSPARQRSGIGGRLTAAAEEFARESGCRFADLRIVHLREELLAIYEKFGYRASGREELPESARKNFTQPCYFIVMTKELGHR